MREPASGRVLYSRGFASIYGEWETTSEVKTVASQLSRVAALSVAATARCAWCCRSGRQTTRFAQIWSTDIDPDSRFVNRGAAPVARRNRLEPVRERTGAEKVDLLVIGEGYTKAELPKFHKDASRLVEALFAHEPFKGRRRDFNVRALDLPSAESGVNRPNGGVFRRTPLSTEYNIFDSERTC